jgi:hypothetical protein
MAKKKLIPGTFVAETPETGWYISVDQIGPDGQRFTDFEKFSGGNYAWARQYGDILIEEQEALIRQGRIVSYNVQVVGINGSVVGG